MKKKGLEVRYAKVLVNSLMYHGKLQELCINNCKTAEKIFISNEKFDIRKVTFNNPMEFLNVPSE